jgi:hypothetical protein
MLKKNNVGNISVEPAKHPKEPYICLVTGAHFPFDTVYEKLLEI